MYSDNMKRIICVLLCILLTVCASSCCCRLPDKQTENADTTERITEESTEEITEEETTYPDFTEIPEDFKAAADRICRSYNAAAVQAAVIKGGMLYYTYEYGISDKENETPVTRDTKFRIASLSKLVTDIIFMKLCEDGRVSLHGDISDMLGFTIRNPYYPDEAITPAMLMSHTASIIDSSDFLNSRLSGSSTPIEALLSGYSSFSSAKPGSAYSYSNFSVALIGCICEKATGKSFEVLADEILFSPLGIDAGYTASAIENRDAIAILYGNGGYSLKTQLNEAFHQKIGQTHHLVQGNLTISAGDYINIAAVICNKGLAADGTRILSENSVEEILTPRYDAYSWQSGFGHLKQYDLFGKDNVCTHTGSNFGMFSAFAIDPESGDGVVILTSGANGSKNNNAGIYSICYDLIEELMPEEAEPDFSADIAATQEEVSEATATELSSALG